jgi:hypothetical protein
LSGGSTGAFLRYPKGGYVGYRHRRARLLQYEMAMILVMHLWDAPIAVVHFNKEGIDKGIK